MPNVIDHFMWGYQPHFRASQELAAKELLGRLDERLQPEVFLVGILDDDRPDRYPACVEPEHDHWIASQAFDGAKARAAVLLPTYPESKLLHSHPLSQQMHDESLRRRSVHDAIIEVLERNVPPGRDLEFFLSWPQKLDGYLVCVVMVLLKEQLAWHRHLQTRVVPLHEYRNVSVTRSLLDAAISILLEEAADQLTKPEPGRFFDRRDTDELVRAAGRQLAMDVAFRADSHELEGFHGFFSACNTISSLKYEQAVGHGTLVIARKDHPAVRPVIRFKGELHLRRFRGARKLLELASHGLALHTNSDSVFSLARYEQLQVETEDLFVVNFLGHYHWELKYNDKILMRVRYEQPYLPRISNHQLRLGWDIPRIFPDASSEDAELLKSLARTAEEEKHGTMLLISADAAGEARRLSSQATLLEPLRLSTDLLPNLTPIDGAVLLDQHGFCHAIGVILDGLATNGGDPSRGARYNSALRYVGTSEIPCLAVVVSEDGGVDLVPNLRPPISRALVEESLSLLAAASSGDVINRGFYSQALKNLSALRFYLLKQDCDKANQAVERAEAILERENPMAIRIVWEPFKANPEMNPDFYYSERIAESRRCGLTRECT